MSKPRALNPQTKHPTPPKPPAKSGEIRDTHQISDVKSCVKSWTPIKISIFFNQPQHSPSRLNGPIARRANTEIRDTHQNLRNSGHPSKSHFPTVVKSWTPIKIPFSYNHPPIRPTLRIGRSRVAITPRARSLDALGTAAFAASCRSDLPATINCSSRPSPSVQESLIFTQSQPQSPDQQSLAPLAESFPAAPHQQNSPHKSYKYPPFRTVGRRTSCFSCLL